jgi:hypothetical protein
VDDPAAGVPELGIELGPSEAGWRVRVRWRTCIEPIDRDPGPPPHAYELLVDPADEESLQRLVGGKIRKGESRGDESE